MKAVVFNNVGDISLQEVSSPTLQKATDAIVRLTTSAICGTDLHLVRGTMDGVQSGTILGHEGIGIVEQIGADIHHIKIGDRVIIPSTIACGDCWYCDLQLFAQCNNANPNGPDAGTAFFGGPKTSGPFNGMQAEQVLVPFADVNLVKINNSLSDKQLILLSDILPTAYMAVEMAQAQPSDTVAVFGCGPVGQLVIACLKAQKVENIIAIDAIPSRLEQARQQGVETINFNNQDVVSTLKKLTNNKGPDKIIDAVGVDAQQPTCSVTTLLKNFFSPSHFAQEVKEVAPNANPNNGCWEPGNGPSQVLHWAVEAIAKAGTISIIGVYPPTLRFFPIGMAMNKNLTLRMGNCNHRKYIPSLLTAVEEGVYNLAPFVSHYLPFDQAIEAYKHFDKREENWIKVALEV